MKKEKFKGSSVLESRVESINIKFYIVWGAPIRTEGFYWSMRDVIYNTRFDIKARGALPAAARAQINRTSAYL